MVAPSDPDPPVAKDEEITMTVPLDERLVESVTAALELYGVHLGRALGLYAALADRGPLTPGELADATGIDVRYAREWLEQQAVAAYLVVDEPDPAAEQRRYALPRTTSGPWSTSMIPPTSRRWRTWWPGSVRCFPRSSRPTAPAPACPTAGTARTSGAARAVSTDRPSPTTSPGRGCPPCQTCTRALGRPGVRIADLGCGLGFSSIALARAYPDAEVVGIDSDPASIDEARELAGQAGVRVVESLAADAAEVGAYGPFDVVVILEALHDMARPVEALRAAHKGLAHGRLRRRGGRIRVQAEFTAPGDLVERMMYGWSISHCLPTQLAEEPSAAIGTVLRASHVASLAEEAGFAGFEETDIDAGFFRVYRLLP